MFLDEESGRPIGTTEAPKAPQSLTVGSTGGGKAIFIDEIVKVK